MIGRDLALMFVAVSLCIVSWILTDRVHHLSDRIDRLEHVRFVCRPIAGSTSGDRVCVAP